MLAVIFSQQATGQCAQQVLTVMHWRQIQTQVSLDIRQYNTVEGNSHVGIVSGGTMQYMQTMVTMRHTQQQAQLSSSISGCMAADQLLPL